MDVSHQTLKQKGRQQWPLAFIALAWLSSWPMLHLYFNWRIEQIFYLVLFAFTIHLNPKQARRKYAMGLVLVILGLFGLTLSKVFFLTGLLFYTLFLLEIPWGRSSAISWVAALFATPVFSYGFEMLGFPIRLWLSQSAVNVLQFVHADINSLGNTIVLQGQEFIVDEACMGLNLLQSGILVGLVMLAQLEKRQQTNFHGLMVFTWVILTFALLLIANWMRIIGIVFFKAMPGTLTHEGIGVCCLILYVFLPLFLGVNYLNNHPKLLPSWWHISGKPRLNSPYPLPWMVGAPTLFFLMTGIFPNLFLRSTNTTSLLNIPEYTAIKLTKGTQQYSNQEALVYVKPGVPVYAADHTPRFCWQGSGYQWQGESTLTVDKEEVQVATILSPEGQVFHTAWWFDNGVNRQTTQMSWRWAVLRGAPPYQLINITATDQATLRCLIQEWRTILIHPNL